MAQQAVLTGHSGDWQLLKFENNWISVPKDQLVMSSPTR